MNKKLILCAPIAMLLASCSTSRMGYLVPESRGTEFEDIAIQGWNTGSAITYGMNYKTGYMETANVTVFQDSHIDNASKLAIATGNLAYGVGSVMSGYGAIRYADAFSDYADSYRKFAKDGFKYNITGNFNGGGGGGGGGRGAVLGTFINNVSAEASAGASAEASAGATAINNPPMMGPGHPGNPD